MRRFFARNIDIKNDTVVVTGDEARHMLTTLRMGRGDGVLLIDGNGTEYVSTIDECAAGQVTLCITERRTCSAEPCIEVTLFQCLPKHSKMEIIIQKCVELGVSCIIPVISKRCVVKADKGDNKHIRWNRIAIEAAKQCGRAFVPTVETPIAIEKIDVSPYDKTLIAYENESDLTLKRLLRASTGLKRIAIIIGPEGGFEPSEVERLLDSGGTAVSLGRRILRTETAGMAMLSQIMYELED